MQVNQSQNITRQLPVLPVRQLPTIRTIQDKEIFANQSNDETINEKKYSRSGELFYYQTSSSSSSPSVSGQSYQENNEEECQTDQQYDENDDDEDVDEEDEQTSPYEYDA